MQLNWKKIPKYCISLERSKERRVLSLREFMRVGLRVVFFDAVDRETLVLPELSPKMGSDKAHEYNAVGAYACMLSHLWLMKQAIAEDREAIAVFEDDAILCEDFTDRIGYIERTGVDFDMLLLGGHFDANPPGTLVGAAQGTNHNHIFQVIAAGGTYGYVITRKVMEFCVRNLHYGFGIDQFFSDVVYKRFNCKAFVPFLVGCRPCVSEITGSFWKYDAIDLYYQHAPVDLDEEYSNPTETQAKRDLQELDRNRALWLKENP